MQSSSQFKNIVISPKRAHYSHSSLSPNPLCFRQLLVYLYRFHINNIIILYVDFCNWVLPLSTICPRFIQVIAYISNSFILIVKYTTMWIIFFNQVHHLFHFRGALMNNVSMSIHTQIFLSGHLYQNCLIQTICIKLFSEHIHHFIFPATVNVGYNSSTILPILVIVFF